MFFCDNLISSNPALYYFKRGLQFSGRTPINNATDELSTYIILRISSTIWLARSLHEPQIDLI